MRITEEYKIFKKIHAQKSADLRQWKHYNLTLGLCPIWLSWIPLVISLTADGLFSPLVNGSLLVFAVTLTGASLGFFAEESRKELKESKQFLHNWMMIILLVGAASYAAILSFELYLPGKASKLLIGILSGILVVIAIALNLHLAAIRLAYGDEDLIKTLMNLEMNSMNENAKAATAVDGTIL